MFEDFLATLQGFKVNKGRSILSLLGIIVGVSSVIITTTLSSSMQSSVRGVFAQFNGKTLFVFPTQEGQGWLKFDPRFAMSLEKHDPRISQTILAYYQGTSASTPHTTLGQAQLTGLDFGWEEVLNVQVEYGASLTPADYGNASYKAVLGSNVATALFPEGSAVGKKFTVYVPIDRGKQKPLVLDVVGVLKKETFYGIFRPEDWIIIPTSVFTHTFGRHVASQLIVSVHDENEAEAVSNEVEQFAAQFSGKKHAVRVFSVQSLSKRIQDVYGVIGLVLSGIAGIALLVGGVGVMNIMLVIVAERRQEIGIRKAIGASNRDILKQFLVESSTLTLSGGFIGVLVGLLLAYGLVSILGQFSQPKGSFHFMMNGGGIIIAFITSVVIGVFFGLYPALQAARLDPVQALEEV